jgi:cytochrome c5
MLCMCSSVSAASAQKHALQVLKQDVSTADAASAALGRTVFERTSAAFKQLMASAVPQLQFDVRMRGSHVQDGVEVLFRAVCGGSSALGDGGTLPCTLSHT